MSSWGHESEVAAIVRVAEDDERRAVRRWEREQDSTREALWIDPLVLAIRAASVIIVSPQTCGVNFSF